MLVAFLIGGTGRPLPVADEIKTKKLTIEDDAGKSRIKLDADKDGPALRLLGETGEIRARVFARSDESGVFLLTKGGSYNTLLTADETGPQLMLGEGKGKLRASFHSGKDGPMLILFDDNNKSRVGMRTVKSGSELVMLDENGKIRSQLASGMDGPSLRLFDDQGKSRALLGTVKTKSPDGIATTYPESTLLLYGSDGNVLWQAPPK